MSRRRCDKYSGCKECDCYSQYTDKLKEIMLKNSYEYMNNFLKKYSYMLTDLYDGNPKFKREYICMLHYYNPNGIYDE